MKKRLVIKRRLKKGLFEATCTYIQKVKIRLTKYAIRFKFVSIKMKLLDKKSILIKLRFFFIVYRNQGAFQVNAE